MFLSKNGGIYFPDNTAEAETSKNVCFAAFSGHKKSKRGKHPRLPYFFKLFLCGSAYRACICTSTAVNALICIYFILAVAFADSLNRTLSSTSAA
jgi:hypothetical protein